MACSVSRVIGVPGFGYGCTVITIEINFTSCSAGMITSPQPDRRLPGTGTSTRCWGNALF
ncbi:MAG: hypothetical protein M0O96_11100 [Desulforhopalus sp.]|nr:hypothetical protein [Desulforhopalus sp.]